MNWFNARYDNPSNDVSLQVEDIYYSRFVTPLRGVGYYNQIGNRYILGNFEFRFPFIKHLIMGWPLPFYFRNIRGATFFDVGTAWYPRDTNSNLLPDPDDWASGFGFAIRMDLGVFPIEWDIAWSPETDYMPQYYFSLNYGF
ncbi:MAG: BamA/TamA family outer membrane protein [Calditrichaeota bacterium]|nr:BamA/TamA family outer membrane protein [Calditrichota bacterium]